MAIKISQELVRTEGEKERETGGERDGKGERERERERERDRAVITVWLRCADDGEGINLPWRKNKLRPLSAQWHNSIYKYFILGRYRLAKV